jgi:DNA-binding CsgD family transcriptional regulator
VASAADPESGLVGRARERALLQAALEETRRAALQVVVLEGEAGIGKSRLLAELRRYAAAADVRFWCGAADELERHRPLRAVVDAVGPLGEAPPPPAPSPAALAPAELAAAQLPRVEGEPAQPDGEAYRGAPDTTFLAVEAAVDRIERAAAEGPAVLALEDLHWADPATLLVIRAVVRRLAALPVLVAVTLRPAPRSPELDRLLAVLPPAATRHLVLPPLDEPDTAALTVAITAGTPAPRLRAEIRTAGGNPLYVIEMLRALAAEGRMSVVDGVADVAGNGRRGGIPESLRRTLQRRMGTLSAPTLDLLRLAAVLGAAFLPAELAQLAGRPLAALLPSVQEAVDAGVLEDAGERLAFRHELLREALYAAIPAGVRTALHRDVGHALAAAGAPAERVAVQLSLGARAGDREAVDWLCRAARQTAPAAPAAAADLLTRAVELCAADDPDRDVLLAELATALTVANRSAAAVGVANGVLDRPHDPRAAAATRLALAQGLWGQGLLHEWMEQVEYGSRATALTQAERARFHAEAAGGQLTFGRLRAAEENARAAVDGGRAAGDDLTVCLGLSALSIVAHYRGHFARAAELGAEVVELAGRAARPELGRRFFYAYQGMFLAVADRPQEAAEVIRAGRALSAGVGVVADVPTYHYVAAVVHYYTGRWEEAGTEAETCVTVAGEIDTRSGVIGASGLLAHLALHRGALADAERHLAVARQMLRESGPQWGVDWLLWGEALGHEARGRTAEARARLVSTWQRHAAGELDHALLRIGPDLVRLLLAADPAPAGGSRGGSGRAGSGRSGSGVGGSGRGGPGRAGSDGGGSDGGGSDGGGSGEPSAAEVAAAVAETAARAGTASARAAALRCQGLLAGDADALLAAAAEYGRGPRVLGQALTLAEAAVVLAGQGRSAESAASFAEALAGFDALGATRDAARVSAALRSVGIRRGVRGARRRPASGWASLTATELQVARLAAEGLTNPQIAQRLYISRYTVETHLKHVFAKLSLTSRVQLAAEVARRAG